MAHVCPQAIFAALHLFRCPLLSADNEHINKQCQSDEIPVNVYPTCVCILAIFHFIKRYTRRAKEVMLCSSASEASLSHLQSVGIDSPKISCPLFYLFILSQIPFCTNTYRESLHRLDRDER